MAILLHKKDAYCDIRRGVDKEQDYFERLIRENQSKLDALKAEGGALRQFEALVAFVAQKERAEPEWGKSQIEISKLEKECKEESKQEAVSKVGLLPPHTILDDAEVLGKVVAKMVSLYKKMQLRISNLSGQFRDLQSRIEQRTGKFEQICQSLEAKESLLARKMQPGGDFGSVMRSFIEESDVPNGSHCSPGALPRGAEALRPVEVPRFHEKEDEREDQRLRGLKAQNRRLLQRVD